MTWMDIKKPKSASWPLVLGVDISNHSLKYVLLRRKGKNLIVEVFGRYVYETNGMDPNALAHQAVSWLFQKHKELKKAKIIVGLGGGKVVIKTESFPKLKRKELLQTIFFGIQKELGGEGEAIEFVHDYKILGPDKTNEGNIQYVTMGAPEEVVDEKVDLFVAEGVIPSKVTPTMLAVANLVQYIPEIEGKESVGVLDIGAQRSTLIIIRNGELDFFREIVVGGDDFTKGITGTVFHEGRAIQFKTEEALEFKIRYGYPLGFSEGMTFLGAPLSEVGMMMRPVVERLTGEIQRSIGFYKEKSDGSEVDTLYLLGGGARLKHLPEALSDKLDIPVFILPNLEGLCVGGDKKQEEAFQKKYSEQAVSLALALESSPEGNLLPESYKKLHRSTFIQRSLQIAAAGLIGLLILLTIFYKGQISTTQIRVASMEAVIAKSKNSGPIFASLLNEKKVLEGKIGSLKQVMDQAATPIQILRLISHATPKKLSLILVKFGKEEKPNRKNKPQVPDEPQRILVNITGVSQDPSNDVRMHVAKLIDEMEKSGYFSDVTFEKDVWVKKQNEYAFELVAYLKDGGENPVK